MIDTAPETVTIPVFPDAKPSDIVRGMPPDRCCTGAFRWLDSNGTTLHCALGALLDHQPGVTWNGSDPYWHGGQVCVGPAAYLDSLPLPPACTAVSADTVLGWPHATAHLLARIFDTHGRDKAADYLESIGL